MRSFGITYRVVQEGEEWVDASGWEAAVRKLEKQLEKEFPHPDYSIEIEQVESEAGDLYDWGGHEQ
jgi:hypothetical protein